jgi:hypothetical protein
MIDIAIKAGLPVICVQTDDYVYAPEVISAIAKRQVVPLPDKDAGIGPGKAVYYSDDQDRITPSVFKQLQKHERQCVFINCKPENIGLDAGFLLPPLEMAQERIAQLSTDAGGAMYAPMLKGLSLKNIEEVIRLTWARFGKLNVPNVRSTRMMLAGGSQGLYPLDTDTGYYEPPDELVQYMQMQRPFFEDPACERFLLPRGLLLSGEPGTGKTAAAKYMGKEWGVPAFRLDIATTLTRYVGESEARIAQSLALLDREEPCIVLFDEVEKVFSHVEKDNSVIERMLTQLLWWLQDHRTRVLVVMTTNNLSLLPPELYREGRLDQVLEMPLLSSQQARNLACRLLANLRPQSGVQHIGQLQQVFNVLVASQTQFSHAHVNKLVVDQIKKQGW